MTKGANKINEDTDGMTDDYFKAQILWSVIELQNLFASRWNLDSYVYERDFISRIAYYYSSKFFDENFHDKSTNEEIERHSINHLGMEQVEPRDTIGGVRFRHFLNKKGFCKRIKIHCRSRSISLDVRLEKWNEFRPNFNGIKHRRNYLRPDDIKSIEIHFSPTKIKKEK